MLPLSSEAAEVAEGTCEARPESGQGDAVKGTVEGIRRCSHRSLKHTPIIIVIQFIVILTGNSNTSSRASELRHHISRTAYHRPVSVKYGYGSVCTTKGTCWWGCPRAPVRPLQSDPYIHCNTLRLSGTSVPMYEDVLLRSSARARRPKNVDTSPASCFVH